MSKPRYEITLKHSDPFAGSIAYADDLSGNSFNPFVPAGFIAAVKDGKDVLIPIDNISIIVDNVGASRGKIPKKTFPIVVDTSKGSTIFGSK